MGRDKAALAYRGAPQLERAMTLLAPHVERAFVSVRADQSAEPLRARVCADRRHATRISDRSPALLAAQARHPHAAWLVLACDLPLLDAATLAHLLRSRAPQRAATAYRSSHDGLPEPCARSTSRTARAALTAYVAAGRDCPRKFLLGADTLLSMSRIRAHSTMSTHPRSMGGNVHSSIRRAPSSPDTSTCSTTRCCASRQAGARKHW